MDTPADPKRNRHGFTLVEMLVVMVIISILVGLTAAVLGPARRQAREFAVKAEINDLQMALQTYKNEYTELPPTFVDINIVAERGGDQQLQDDARNAVVRHLRKAFPRYQPGQVRYRRGAWPPGPNPNPLSRPEDPTNTDQYEEFANDVFYAYYDRVTNVPTIDPLGFDPASALVFWLGGLPETVPAAGGQWIPAGFHSDPEEPFKPGTPRTQPLFTCKPKRIVVHESHYSTPWDSSSGAADRFLRYYPDKVDAPYVYFKSRQRGMAWQYGAVDSNGNFVPYWYYHSLASASDVTNVCVAYRDPQDPPFWRNHDSCQIIAAGLDGQFGKNPPLADPADPASGVIYRLTKVPQCVIGSTGSGPAWSKEAYDNLANFCEKMTLEDEIEQ